VEYSLFRRPCLRRSYGAWLVFAALALCPVAAAAQDTTGTIRGAVVDAPGLAVPSAAVSAAGPQGRSETVSDPTGNFTLPFLTPGTYVVRAELSGFKAFEQTGVIVSLGQTVNVRARMEVGGVAETVTVAAGASLDFDSPAADTVISTDFLETVPVGRRLADTLYLAPGVSASNTVGRMNPSISGGAGLDNQYVIDGVNVTSAGYGGLGSFSSVFRSLGNATPFDFIKEIQVKTAGSEAEFSQSLGGTVNVITQSGSNDFRASLFGFARPRALEGEWKKDQTPNGTVQTLGSQTYDAGLAIGGPIARDRLFFFAAVNPSRDVQTFEAPDGFPLLSLGEVDRVRTSSPYSAKLTAQINGNHRLDASFFGDPSRGRDGAQRPAALLATTTAQFSTLTWGGHSQTVRYDGVFSNRWLLEAAYGRALNRFSERPDSNTWQYRDMTVTPNVRSGGIGAFEPGNRGENHQFTVKSTNLIGGHSIKYGFEYDQADWMQLQSYTGPTLIAPNGQQTASGAIVRIMADATYGKFYRVSNAFFEGGASTSQSYSAAFVQDTWRIGQRLTLTPGLRLERQTISGNVTKDWSLGNNVAPRIGAAFDPTGDGRTKVSAHWGRFFARMPNDLAARTLSGETVVTRADYFDANLTQPIPEGLNVGGVTVHYATVGGAAGDAIDPDTRMPYLDEFTFGVDREVMPGTTFGLRYVFRDLGRTIEDQGNCPIVGVFLDETAGICGHVTATLTNPSSATPVNPDAIAAYPAFANVAFADPTRRYHAVEATLNRRVSASWSGMAWYRWSQLRGNYEGFYRDDTGQSDPGISTLYDFPQDDPTFASIGGPLAGFLGDIQYLADPNGILPLDRPHQFKLIGNYVHDRWNAGVVFGGSSGAPLTPFASHPIPGYTGGEIPLAPRGSGIQTVDGFMKRTPFTTQLDVQLAYQLPLGSARHLSLVADVFNLFDQQTVQSYDMWSSLTFSGGPNPNYGYPTSSVLNVAGPQRQAPRQVRLGARFTF
jgi:hypothetical protein